MLETHADAPGAIENTDSGVEEAPDKEVLSRQLLTNAADSYIVARSKEIIEPGESPVAAGERAIESLRSNHELLQDLSGERTSNQEPAYTVCIPAAIIIEKPERLAHTLELIQKAQEDKDEPIEVILWANAKYEDNDEKAAIEQQAAQAYSEVSERLQKQVSDKMRVQTALQVLPAEEATMSNIRANFMEALAVDAVERGYGFDHPFIWLDADTSFMTKDTLSDLAHGVRSGEGLVVHANTQYSIDWANGQPLEELDDASKAAAINEIRRRQQAREKDKSFYYPEESGLASSLGAYLVAKGTDRSDPVNESNNLVARIRQSAAMGSIPGVKDAHPLERDMLELLGIETNQGRDVPSLVYIDSARLGLSARRHHRQIEAGGASAMLESNAGYVLSERHQTVHGVVSDTEGGGLYSDLSTNEQKVPISRSDMIETIREHERRHGKLGSAAVYRLIDKHFIE